MSLLYNKLGKLGKAKKVNKISKALTSQKLHEAICRHHRYWNPLYGNALSLHLLLKLMLMNVNVTKLSLNHWIFLSEDT